MGRVAELGSLGHFTRVKRWNITSRQTRLVRLFAFGTVACALTLSVGYALFRFALLVPFLIETKSLGTALVVLLLLNGGAAFALFLWRDFYRTLRARA